ncbi:MAG: hypothetical protein JXM69_07460 [Anaerolineae bacterium]|nr:hypothetical protein [Anaerolineae bacterium]
MTDFKDFLSKLYQNLNLLEERKAKYATNPPLDLLNQIDDHRQAITLTQQAIANEISEARWLAELQPLLISRSDWLGVSLAVQLLLAQVAAGEGTAISGPEASQAAEQVVQTSLAHLRQSPKGEWLANEFEQDPVTYQKPIEKELIALLAANSDLVAQLKALLAQYHQALQAHLQQTGGVQVQGDGATVIQQGDQSQAITGSSIGGDVLGPGASKS